MPSKNCYQLKVTLIGSKPSIWRRVLVPGNMTLDKLHLVIQISMGWFNCHLHQFIADGVCYGIRDGDFGVDMDVENESSFQLNQLLQSEKKSIKYEYDFGDGWIHKILLEKILPPDNENQIPRCMKGKMACPPEDCGGVWGYQDLLDSLNDPKHPEHESMLEWIGGKFDPEAFHMEAINIRLANYV